MRKDIAFVCFTLNNVRHYKRDVSIGECPAPPKNFGNVQNPGGAGHRLSFDIIFYNGHFDTLSDRMSAPRQPHCHSARMQALSAAS